jgi:phosphoglycolate phosphatase
MSSTAPRAIIFDWDNTLIDSWHCIQAATNATLRHMGHPEWDLDETRRRVTLSMRDAFPALFGARWEEARDVFTSTFAAIHLDHLVELPGTTGMLHELRELGTRLYVVSNKRGHFLRKEAEALAWTPLFESLVGAGDAECDKPDPAPVRLALGEGDIGTDVWFVGDTSVDLQCAVNAGLLPVLMRVDPPRPGEMDLCQPRHHVRDCEGLMNLVKQLKVPISGY